jgi:alginate O-acetyltransferase complex protein AlgI
LMRRGWPSTAKWCLICASLLFYAWSAPHHLLVLTGSIVGNYLIGAAVRGAAGRHGGGHRAGKAVLIAGVTGNVLLLVYFKYANFLMEIVSYVIGTHFSLAATVAPLGVSFFTFTQIAYLVDVYRQPDARTSPLDYCLLIAFFPRVLSGPITRYSEMIMPAFPRTDERRVDYAPLTEGVFLFSLGLFKKVVLATLVGEWADNGFASAHELGLVEAWVTTVSYSLQLYFDFSGYTDMALGAALMFNVRLPINFRAPYRATSIQDFWTRWHMTLSRFLRDYLYIPLGGSRVGELRTIRNILITFLLCGLWHGAGGLFVLWGLLHGLGLTINRVWRKTNFRMNALVAWIITFGFVNAAWVFFRAQNWGSAMEVFKGMAGLHGIKLPASWGTPLAFMSSQVTFTDGWLKATQGSDESVFLVAGLLVIAVFGGTSDEIVHAVRRPMSMALFSGFILFISLIYMLSMDKQTPFIYFRF